MNTKKKFIVALSSLGIVTVGVLVSLVAVLAAFTTNSLSGFQVSYTAVNVQAKISGTYALNGTAAQTIKANSGAAEFIEFGYADNDASGVATKNFDEITGLALAKENGSVVLHYTIENTATDGSTFAVDVTQNGTPTNLKVEYSTNNTNWSEDITTIESASVSAADAHEVYVRITIVNNTQNASWENAGLSFQLTIND